jgi:oligopeptide transport system substrate-binding protein
MRSVLQSVILVALLISCTRNIDSIRLTGREGSFHVSTNSTMRLAVGTEPPTIDWHKSTDTTSSLIINNIMEGLTAFNIESDQTELIPALAVSWDSSPDFKVWKFKLRTDVTWSDGVPFKASHVVDGWRRLLDPETAGEYAYFLFSVKNAQDYNSGQIKDPEMIGVKALSDHELQVELDNGFSFFPSLLSHPSTFPVRLDVVEKHGSLWTEAGNLVSLGPYTLKEWRHDEYLLLEANPNYFGGEPKVKYVLGRVVERSATAVRLFSTGQLDALTDLPHSDLRRLKKLPTYSNSPNLLTYFYGFKIQDPVVGNVHLRRAINHAIDKQQIITVLDGGQTPLPCWLPEGLIGYSEDVGLKFDLEKAKEELKKAGYSSGADVPTIVLGFNTNEGHKLVAENVQQQLRKNLGLRIEVINEEWKTYLSRLNSDPYPIFRMGWLADYPDPDNFLNLMTSFSDNNRGKWKNPKFDELIKKGASEQDTARRAEIYLEAQRLLCEVDAAAIPLYMGVSHYLIHERVKNFPRNNLGYYRFHKVVLE